MSLNVLELCPNFSAHEPWGDLRRVNPLLIVLLQGLRDHLEKPIVLHCVFEEDGHATNSQHYLGNAADFHVHGMDFLDAAELVRDFLVGRGLWSRVGFGVYPDWHRPGFHLDIRGADAKWAQVDGKYVAYKTGLKRAENAI